MARTPGARNHDFTEKRSALLDLLTDFALNSEFNRPSLRQFAMAAGITEPTLRHYFSDRQGLITAVLQRIGERGQPIWAEVAVPADSSANAMQEFFQIALFRLREGHFVRAHAFGLSEGIANEEVGRAYLKHVLEPALNSVYRKLEATPGQPEDPVELRAAALAALSPLLIISLHQELLGGRSLAPLDNKKIVMQLSAWLSNALSGPD